MLFAAVACKPAGDGGDSGRSEVLRAFPETADIAMYFDQKAMSESAFSEQIENLQDELPEAQATEELTAKLTEITGLEDDDITEFALALSGMENAQANPSAIKVSGALFATKAVSADQIVEAIEYVAEQNGEKVELTVTVGEGADYIDFPVADGMPQLRAAVVSGESSTTAFFGDDASVEAALQRKSGSIPAALSAPSEGLVAGQQGWISIIVPESLKGQLAGLTAQGEQMAPGLSKLQSLQSIGVGVKATDVLDVAIGLNLGSPDDAKAITAVLNNQLISFAKMMLAGSTPEPLPLLESLSASQNGDRAVLALALSLGDMEQLQSQLMNFLPGAAPMAPSGAPVPPPPPAE